MSHSQCGSARMLAWSSGGRPAAARRGIPEPLPRAWSLEFADGVRILNPGVVCIGGARRLALLRRGCSTLGGV